MLLYDIWKRKSCIFCYYYSFVFLHVYPCLKTLNFRISDRIKTINIFLISVGFYNLMESNIGILLIPKGFLTNEPLTDGLLSPIGNFCAGSDNYLTL